MTITAKRDAIAAWFSGATGLTTIWSGQGAPRPAYPYATLSALGDAPAGTDHRWREVANGVPGESDMVLDLREESVLTVSCQVFVVPGAHESSAEQHMKKARRALSLPSTRWAFRVVGLAVAETMPIQEPPAEVVNGAPILRAAMDVQFNAANLDVAAETNTYIAKVTGTINGGAFDADIGA